MSSSPVAASASKSSDQEPAYTLSSPSNKTGLEKDSLINPRSPTLSTTIPPTRPLSDVIGETFSPFDHQTLIVTPFNEELDRDHSFEQELNSMLLNAILETHAWASTRPKHESLLAAQTIEQKVFSLMETETTQDKMRQQLHQFVTQIKSALAVLTGLTRI